MTTIEAQYLAELYPLEQCSCGAVTLGGSDVRIENGNLEFPQHKHEGD